MKFGVCAIIKNENLYLREWVEHYIKLGFDKIILYDNNNINGEVPNVVVQDYIDQGYVDIINWKITFKDFEEYHTAQKNAYNNCLEKYKDELDWIAFLDIDEFLELEKHTKIQYLFEDYVVYNNFDVIIMSWCMMGNENELYYKNLPVQQRFTKHLNGKYAGMAAGDMLIKSFVNTKTNSKFTIHAHCPKSENVCISSGNKCGGYNPPIYLNIPNHFIMYIKHYFTKSLTEYLCKLFNKDLQKFHRGIEDYKNLNGWSEEHEKVYQNFLKNNNIKAS